MESHGQRSVLPATILSTASKGSSLKPWCPGLILGAYRVGMELLLTFTTHTSIPHRGQTNTTLPRVPGEQRRASTISCAVNINCPAGLKAPGLQRHFYQAQRLCARPIKDQFFLCDVQAPSTPVNEPFTSDTPWSGARGSSFPSG